MKVVRESNFNSEVIQSREMVIVDFYADWCDTCKSQASDLESLAEEFEGSNGNGGLKFVKVNIDKSSNLVDDYRVIHLPTLFLFKEGKPIQRIIGFKWESDLRKILRKMSTV
jgi:thioredoxin 1